MTTPDELASQARAVLPAAVYAYYAAGSGTGATAHDQQRAWRSAGLRPRILRDVSHVDPSTTVLGSLVSSPVLLAPSAAHALAHAHGELATAQAARAAGSLLVLSMRSSTRLEQVAEQAGPWWQQIYVLRDRGISDEVARRAAAAGARALVLTVDTPYVARKVGAPLPSVLAHGLIPELDARDASNSALQQAPDLTPADIGRLADISGLPVVAKGVLRGDEALRCLDSGAAAIVVSTHGGRQLDGVIGVPWALAEVADAVGDRGEIYADGGIRTGVDVLRALALGARAIMLGRPVLWGLAVAGAAGVSSVLDDLRAEFTEALALAGCASCGDVGPDLVSLASR